MPNLKPPMTDDRRHSRRTARAFSRRCRPALQFEPLMTLYLTDTTTAGRDPQGGGERVSSSARSSIPPARRRIPTPASPSIDNVWAALEAMAEARPRAAGARRGDRRRRSTCSTASTRSSTRCCSRVVERVPRPQGRVRARHDARRGRVRARRARRRGRDDHAAAPAAESQCAVRGRHAPASLLPAGAEARTRSRGAARGRDERRCALLPRHRQRAARAARQGNGLRLRRHLLGARRASSCTPKRSSRRAASSG